jgi:DNA-directed RNA polymerase specialized sigma24 family protein
MGPLQATEILAVTGAVTNDSRPECPAAGKCPDVEEMMAEKAYRTRFEEAVNRHVQWLSRLASWLVYDREQRWSLVEKTVREAFRLSRYNSPVTDYRRRFLTVLVRLFLETPEYRRAVEMRAAQEGVTDVTLLSNIDSLKALRSDLTACSAADLKATVHSVRADLRLPLVLNVVEELPTSEIARVTGLSVDRTRRELIWAQARFHGQLQKMTRCIRTD